MPRFAPWRRAPRATRSSTTSSSPSPSSFGSMETTPSRIDATNSLDPISGRRTSRRSPSSRASRASVIFGSARTSRARSEASAQSALATCIAAPRSQPAACPPRLTSRIRLPIRASGGCSSVRIEIEAYTQIKGVTLSERSAKPDTAMVVAPGWRGGRAPGSPPLGRDAQDHVFGSRLDAGGGSPRPAGCAVDAQREFVAAGRERR